MAPSKNIYWLGGSWHDRKEFILKEIVVKKQQQGWEVVYWDKDTSLETSGQMDFFAPSRLVIVPPKTRIGKKQIETLAAFASEELMLVICETAGVPSSPVITASIAYIHHFPEPNRWEMDAKYGEIFKDLLKKRYNKEMDLDLATEIVKRVGQDFALMEKEALKYSSLPDTNLTIQVIAGVVSVSPQFDAFKLVDGVVALDPVAFLRACMKLEAYATSDQTMALCRGALGTSVYSWLEAHAMLKERVSIDEICEKLGIKYKSKFERQTIPLLNKLGEDGLEELIGLISDCERAVLLDDGVGDPFLILKYGLLKFILKYSNKGKE